MADTITYRLSSIDQSIIRAYMRYSLIFPCGDGEVAREQIAMSLTASVKRAIFNTPIFAGKIYASAGGHEAAIHDSVIHDSIESSQQAGRVEVRVTLGQVNDFKPTIKVLSVDDFPHTYHKLNATNMPADAFINDALTPLPDMPDDEDDGALAFAVQANFIEGGVIVCLYLHHSVADLKGLACALKAMSNAAEPVEIHTQQTLEQDASDQSRLRDRLSGSRGVKANLMKHPEYDVAIQKPLAPSQGTSRVLAFSTEKLVGTKIMVNERFHCMNNEPDVHLYTFDILAGVLWKAITRAQHSAGKRESRIFIPVDMATRVDCFLEEDEFYGNSCLYSCVAMELSHLAVPFDISSMAKVARKIRDGISSMTETKARSAIAVINEAEDVKTLHHSNIDFSTDVFITNWADLPIGTEAGLGLGLGTPKWTRKVSRSQSAYECVLLPLKEDVWEVTVSMADDEMARLVEDIGLKPFLVEKLMQPV